jgi:N6-adenosine-specific RNA methylase IME4
MNDDYILRLAKAIQRKKYEQSNAARLKKIIEISRGNKELGVDKTYPVIYADPPWNHDSAANGVPENFTKRSKSSECQYPTMSLDEIKALPVAKLATPHAVLFLWTPSAKLKQAIEVVEAWGFEQKSTMVWVKDRIGMGFYVRTKHELLLIATRGEMPVPLPKNRPPSVISSPRGKHSEKPVCVYRTIESMYPDLPKIELFARKQYPRWSVWGNQATEKRSVLPISA